MTAYRVFLTPAADRQLAKFPGPVREMVAAVLVTLASNPRPTGCVKLSGSTDLWRVRVRDYRIVYTIADDQLVVTVVTIGHRMDVYR